MAFVLQATPAVAVNTRHPAGSPGVCGDTSGATWFFDGTEWTTTLEARFEAGFDAWRYDVEKWSGGYLLSSSGQSWTARWKDLGTSPKAQTVCFVVHNIEFNTEYYEDYLDNSLSLTGLAAHEWGHAFGLGHVGNNDGYPTSGNPPTMATCKGFGATSGSLSKDDEAAITAQNEIVDGYRTLTANSSFEEGSPLEFWSTQNVAAWSSSTSGGGVDGSPTYATFKGDGASDAAVFNDTYISWYSVGSNIKGRANYRKNVSTDVGTITVTMKWAYYEHDSPTCSGLATTSWVSGWTEKSKVCTPSTSWSFCTTAATFVGGVAQRVLRTRVVVYNRMVNGLLPEQPPAYVEIDRTRTMVNDGAI